MHRFVLFGLFVLAACGPESREAAVQPDGVDGQQRAVAGAPTDQPTDQDAVAADAETASVQGSASGSACACSAQAARRRQQREQATAAALAQNGSFDAALRGAFAAQHAATIAAARRGERARGSSLLDAPTPFDRAAWLIDPWGVALAWCQTAEAGRVYQVGPSADPPLMLISEAAPDIDPTQPPTIVVQARPFAPVSAYSPDRVVFANDLPFTTVIADVSGRATITTRIPAGTSGPAAIRLASPVCSGTCEVHLSITHSTSDHSAREIER